MPNEKSRRELVKEIERLRKWVAKLQSDRNSEAATAKITETREKEKERGPEFFLSLFNDAALPMYVKDAEYRWVFANTAACVFFDLEREALPGKTDFDLFTESEAHTMRGHDERVMHSGEPDLREEEIVVNGRVRHVASQRSRYLDPLGREKYLLCVLQEVTLCRRDNAVLKQEKSHLELMLRTCSQRLVQSNQSLQEKTQEYQLLERLLEHERQTFSGGPVVVCKWAAEAGWPVEYISPNIAQFGYRSGYFNSRLYYQDLIHPRDLPRIQQEAEKLTAEGADCFEQTYRLIGGDGMVRRLYDFKTAIRNPWGKLTHYYGYILDITEQHQISGEARAGETRFRILAETLPHGVAETDLKGVILFCNQRFHELLGYRGDALLGKSFWQLYNRPRDEGELAGYLSYLAEKQPAPAPYNTLMRRNDGGLVNIRLDWNYKRTQNGRVTGFITVATDITQSRKLELALRESQADLQRIADSAPVMLRLSRPDGYFDRFNRKWLEFTGLSLQELAGDAWLQAVHPEEQEHCRNACAQALAAHQAFTLRYRLRSHAGEFREFTEQAEPYFDADRNFAGYIAVSQTPGGLAQ